MSLLTSAATTWLFLESTVVYRQSVSNNNCEPDGIVLARSVHLRLETGMNPGLLSSPQDRRQNEASDFDGLSSPSPRDEGVGRGELPVNIAPKQHQPVQGTPLPGSTAVELSQLRRTWSAEFIPLPADLHVPRGGGLKSALLNSTAVGTESRQGRKSFARTIALIFFRP